MGPIPTIYALCLKAVYLAVKRSTVYPRPYGTPILYLPTGSNFIFNANRQPNLANLANRQRKFLSREAVLYARGLQPLDCAVQEYSITVSKALWNTRVKTGLAGRLSAFSHLGSGFCLSSTSAPSSPKVLLLLNIGTTTGPTARTSYKQLRQVSYAPLQYGT